MPLTSSNYSPSSIFKNGHFSTIYPNLLRKIRNVRQNRERIELDDGDFIDIDWSYTISPTEKVAVIIHGLEGNAQRQYVLGLARHLNNNNWDVVAVNLRNCSGEVNRLYQSYNAGVSEDLEAVVQHIISANKYEHISICGFSLGGNITLKFLGEGRNIPKKVKSAVAISVPCDLFDSLTEINKTKNILYQQRFIRSLKKKLHERQKFFPDMISTSDIAACTSLIDIDDLYTSRAHGYKNAKDYYTKCSSKQFLKGIEVPTLIINAKNDTFLGNKCYPIEAVGRNSHLFLEIPDFGGHVGFYQPGGIYYHEERITTFLQKW